MLIKNIFTYKYLIASTLINGSSIYINDSSINNVKFNSVNEKNNFNDNIKNASKESIKDPIINKNILSVKNTIEEKVNIIIYYLKSQLKEKKTFFLKIYS